MQICGVVFILALHVVQKLAMYREIFFKMEDRASKQEKVGILCKIFVFVHFVIHV